MRIAVVTPAGPGANNGNRVTANRWARILRGLGHRVSVAQQYDGRDADLLVAVHAVRSAGAIQRFSEHRPGRPIVVLLAGTDIYGDLYGSEEGRRSARVADRLVTLQPLAIEELRGPDQRKARTIVQSAAPTVSPGPSLSARHFGVAVIGHLRLVKDPFRAALASHQVPASSGLRIVQGGRALSLDMARWAQREADANPRYRWLGAVPHWHARRVLRRAHAMVISSVSEGGANVVSEAVADSVPVLASRMPGNVGLLGERYPGYFPVGGTAELAGLLIHAEESIAFRHELVAAAAPLKPLIDPAYEAAAWRDLIAELAD